MSRISELTTNLTNLNLNSNQIIKIEGLENMENLIELNLGYNKINKIEGLENLQKLETITLVKNEISDITPLSENINLKYINLNQNPNIDGDRANYTPEQIEKLNKLSKVIDNGGKILLDVEQLGLFNNYRFITIQQQNLTSIEFLKGMDKLITLNLAYNQITLEDQESQNILKSLKNLQSIDLRSNKVTNIKGLNELQNLQSIDLRGNKGKVHLKDIEDIISKIYLGIDNESLQTIEECDSSKITKLNISAGTNITYLPNLTKFSKLTNLNLSGNQFIENIEMVENLTSLKELNLRRNQYS